MVQNDSEDIVLGGGCFWCLEALFKMINGVGGVLPGYAGGHLHSPTYKEVSTGSTGHAEVIRVEFNPHVVNLETLLSVFFAIHDPTTLNRQGEDVGSQYRSIIFYTNDNQRLVISKFVEDLRLKGEFNDPIVTTIEQLEEFYEAETYHHLYYQRNPKQPYCEMTIAPKIAKFKKLFSNLIINTP